MKNFTFLSRVIVLFIFLTMNFAAAYAQQIEKALVMSTGERIGFLEYKPKNYSASGNTKYPVIIFLHGIGERGNGTTELKNVANYALPKMIKNGHPMTFTWNGKTETFLVISPQCPISYGMWPQKMINEFVEYARKELRSDTNRIYLTGLSMGGGGSMRYISTHAEFPKRVSAVATVCTPCTFDNGDFVAKAKLPVWAFHAADDNVALSSCTDRAINRINAANPEVKPLRTIWPTGGHNVWDRVYTDTNYVYDGVLNIYEWFLGQNKSLAVNKLPVANAGADQLVSTKQGTVTLNGSGSKDSDGKIVRYVWKKISGPNSGKITAVRSAASSTTITGLTVAGVYTYELSVVDDRAGFSKDTVRISASAELPAPAPPKDTVKPSPVPPKDTLTKPTPADTVKAPQKPVVPGNIPPVARTQGDRVVPIEWNWAPSVSGSPSTDQDGWIALFTWEKISGPDSYKIVSPRSCATKLENLVPGVYVFRVTAYDNKGASSTADVKVTMTKEEPKKTTTKATTSNSVVIEENIPTPLTILSMPAELIAYPSPAVNMVNIQYNSEASGKSLMSIFDASGKLIRNINFQKNEGRYSHNLDISRLNTGVYYVKIQTAGASQMQTRFVKK